MVDLSGDLLELSASGTYQGTFAWVDNIRLVEEDSVVENLYTELISGLLADPIPANIDAILPDDLLEVDDDRAIRYILFPRERKHAASRINLTIEMIAALAESAGGLYSPQSALGSELRFLDDSMETIGKTRLIDCICADLIVNGEQFIAYDGDFYRVERKFAQRIDDELSQLPDSPITFPKYSGETEPLYIDLVRRNHGEQFVVLDRGLIRIDGESGIEACDLVSSGGALVHLKRKGKSSVLSHLFLQVANSCELLRRSSDARQRLESMIKENSTSPELTESICRIHSSRLGGEGLEVVFAILGDWKRRTIVNLPLFSRISLVQESRRVAALGYRPSVALISSRAALG